MSNGGKQIDSQCNWYPDPEGEDIWPELMLAIRHGHIVSAVTSEPRRLPARLWICTGERGQAATCYPRSIDAATRQRWSGQWRAFFNATN
jgi:hypothetical protein